MISLICEVKKRLTILNSSGIYLRGIYYSVLNKSALIVRTAVDVYEFVQVG